MLFGFNIYGVLFDIVSRLSSCWIYRYMAVNRVYDEQFLIRIFIERPYRYGDGLQTEQPDGI